MTTTENAWFLVVDFLAFLWVATRIIIGAWEVWVEQVVDGRFQG